MKNTPESRVEAIELFLQQLVFLLEAEKKPTVEKMARWFIKIRGLGYQHQTQSLPVLAAFGDLIERVLLDRDLSEPDAAAKQAAQLVILKAQGHPPAA